MIKKLLAGVIFVVLCLVGCYSAQGNKSLTYEEGKNKVLSSDVIKIDVHNITLNNDVDVYAGNDKIGDISGKFIAIWDTLKFTDVDGNIIRTGKQNAYLLFDNWTVYDKDERMLFIMKEKFNLISVSYDILDAEENTIATLKKGAIQLSNSATIKNVNDEVIAEIKQSPFRNDFNIEFGKTDEIDKESVIIISTNYMMQKIYQDRKR